MTHVNKLAIIVVPLVAVIAFLGWRSRSATEGVADSEAATALAGQGAHAAAPGSPAHQPPSPPSAVNALVAARDIPALQARDQRRRSAMVPFQGSVLAALDSCLSAGPGPRAPQRLLLRFERGPSSDAARERFTLAAVEPVAASPGQASLRDTPGWACFGGLVGRPLDIPVGPGAQESTFQEVVTLPLPISLGGGTATPPHFQNP